MLNRRAMVLTPVALVGCANNLSLAPDGTALLPGEGVLAMHVSSNVVGALSFVPYGPSTYGARVAENLFGADGSVRLIQGEQFLVQPFKAGNFMWSKLGVGNRWGRLYDSTRFSVLPGAVTYIGHLRVFASEERFGLRALDREADMRAYLLANYPKFAQLPFERRITEVGLPSPVPAPG